jgi:hypothetical protein
MRKPSVWNYLTLLVLSCGFSAVGQSSLENPPEYSFTISASQPWTDTGIDLSAGDSLVFNAASKVGSANDCSPNGAVSNSSEKLPLSSAPSGALLARTAEKADALLVGASHELKADGAGHLFLGVNQATPSSDCAFTVKVKITHAPGSATAAQPKGVKEQLSSAAQVWLKGQFGSTAANKTQPSSAVSENALPTSTTSTSASSSLKPPTTLLDSDLRQHIDGLPRRVHDHLGNLGDMVNFVFIGSQDRVQAALEGADWHLADVDSKEAGLKAILNTYEKKDYLEMPMSHLYLFDRMQDFGYEQAQAYAVVASRHHFRMWKAPFTWNNEVVWVGAGTHDTGFEKDVRTGKLTHKIDPDVDTERENIAQSLNKSGKIKGMNYYLPPNPVQDAKNASGGGYHSDGRLLVVFLQ